VRWGGPESAFVLLTGRDALKTQFVLVAPDIYFPEYRPVFSAEHLASVGLDQPENAAVVVIVTLRVEPDGPTANLLGPLLINPNTGAAIQAVLHDGGWETTAPLVAPSSKE
jgi:flagellar assembly factor FliW